MTDSNQGDNSNKRISYLSEYLKSNPTFSKEQLLKASLAAGYTQVEFDAAFSLTPKKVSSFFQGNL